MDTVNQTYNRIRSNFNFICSRLAVDNDELLVIGETVQKIERDLVLLKTQQSESNH